MNPYTSAFKNTLYFSLFLPFCLVYNYLILPPENHVLKKSARHLLSANSIFKQSCHLIQFIHGHPRLSNFFTAFLPLA